jgi:hypothetical protein
VKAYPPTKEEQLAIDAWANVHHSLEIGSMRTSGVKHPSFSAFSDRIMRLGNLPAAVVHLPSEQIDLLRFTMRAISRELKEPQWI